MTNQTLAKTVARILRQHGMSKMGFQLGGLVVTGMRYSIVAKAVEEGKIECRVVNEFKPQTSDQLAPGMVTVAEYKSDLNAMLFSREDYASVRPSEERVIVHEATHAMFDLFANTQDDRTLAIDDESAAVLAEALYLRLCDRPAGNFAMFIDGPQDEALKLADKMMAETGDFERDRRTYFLKSQQTEKLRAAVARDWHFTKYIGSDGYETDATGTQYIYNGVVKCYSCWIQGKE
jgi:hypothetical protein